MRTLQYVAKLFVFYYARQTGLDIKTSELIQKLENLAKVLGDGRRLFRAGKYIGTFLAAQKGANTVVAAFSKSNPFPHLTFHNAFLRNLALTIYYILDQYVWLARLKLIDGKQLDRFSLLGMRCWSLASFIALICDVYVYKTNTSLSAEGRQSLKLKILKNTCDMPLAFTSSFPSQAALISPGLINASGVVSSLAGLILAWRDV